MSKQEELKRRFSRQSFPECNLSNRLQSHKQWIQTGMSLHCRRKWKRGHLRWIWIQGPQTSRHVRKQNREFPTTSACGWVPLLTSYSKMSKQEVRPKSGMVKALSVSIPQPVFTHASNALSEPKLTSCHSLCCHEGPKMESTVHVKQHSHYNHYFSLSHFKIRSLRSKL